MSGIPLNMMRPVTGGKKGSRGDYGEVSKLIEGLSSDSEQEQFSLPPLELRTPGSKNKRYKERTQKAGASAESCCSCKLAVCTLILLVLCVMVAGLAVLTYSMNKDLQELKSKMGSVESGSASNPDEFQDLHRKQQELQDLIKDIKSSKTGIDAHETNISLLFKQLQVLNQTTKGLLKSVEAAPALHDLPGRVEGLTKQVAGFGSDITNLKSGVDELKAFKTTTESALTDLQTNDEKDESSQEDADIPSVILESISSLSSKVDALNSSASSKYLAVMGLINKHTRDIERLNTSLTSIQGRLELIPTTSPDEVSQTISEVQQHISDAVEKLRQATVAKDEFQILQNKVQNITSSLEMISIQHASISDSSSQVTSDDLEQLRSDMNQCCTKCAESMKSFNATLLELKTGLSTDLQTSGTTGAESSPTAINVQSTTATPPQLSTTGTTGKLPDTETKQSKIATRDLHRSAVGGREGVNNKQRDSVSEMLKKAIEESDQD